MTIHQAVLLVGGRGTRMWPLTASVPKGIIPVAGVPFVDLQIRQLSAVGIDEVFLAVGRSQLSDWETFAADRAGVRLVVEDEPLDTAGPVRAALPDLDDRFMVLNGDVVVEADLAAYLDAVRDDAAATLALVEVDDTSAYGVVVLDASGVVERFVEKPPVAEAPARTVNAGMYVMTRSALASYPNGALSFERTVFPALTESRALHGVTISGRWFDIGTPQLYLDSTGAVLQGATSLHQPPSPHLVEGSCEGTTSGAWSWVAPGAVVESGATIHESVVLPGAVVHSGALVSHGVIGWGAEIGVDAIVTGSTMIGANASIGSGCELVCGARVAPSARLEPGTITFSPPK
jgi:mannose-1-phosphate guanylyltransferase